MLESFLFHIVLGILVLILKYLIWNLFFSARMSVYAERHPTIGLDGSIGKVLKNGSAFEKSIDFFDIVVVSPSLEEFIFRGPILLLAQINLAAAFIVAIPLSIGFGFMHKLGEKSGDNANGPMPNFMYWYISIYGFLFSTAVIISGSLWPAIFAHSASNIIVSWENYKRIKKLKQQEQCPKAINATS